jgi:hypothetical protein
MTHTKVRPEQWTICAVLLFAAVLPPAAPASADPTDLDFIAALAKEGITFSDRNPAIAIGHRVGAGLDKNDKSSVVVLKLIKDTDLSLKQSSYFVGASISAYCPQYIGRTDDSVYWLNPGPPLM